MSSTAKNLMFLEAMLGRYMHEHYIDETDSAMYTKPVGFRMPYTRGITDLERNMKYVEVQLDKFLHTHESNSDLIALTNGDIEHLSNGVIIPGNESATGPYDFVESDGSEADMAAWDYINQEWARDVLVVQEYPWFVSNSNPHSGSVHLRREVSDQFSWTNNPIHFGTTTATLSGVPTSVIPIGAGVDYTASAYVQQDYVSQQHAGNELEHALVIWYYNSSGTFISIGPTDTLLSNTIETTPYTLLSVSGTTPTNTAYVVLEIVVNFATFFDGWNVNVDDVTFTSGGTTLYWTPKGFRFPYDWKRPDAINNNRRFLETELSQYLHEHEAVTT